MEKWHAAVILFFFLAGCLQVKQSGTIQSPFPYSAPDFTLTNQFGEKTRLSDLRGRVVVLSFLYTSCPHVCPALAGKFATAAKMLEGASGAEVVFVAVSVDPERDTIEHMRGFVEEKGLRGKMLFLTGERSELEKVWSDYFIYVNGSVEQACEDSLVDHTALVLLLDKKGDVRLVYQGLDWQPESLAGDARSLMNEERFLHRLLYGRRSV